MEKEHLEELINLSFQMEMKAAELYRLFSENSLEDKDFWWELHLEEIGHARIIREAKDNFLHRGVFPFDMLCASIEKIQHDNARAELFIEQAKAAIPSRRGAFEIAFALEHSASELHFDLFMKQKADEPLVSVLQQLNQADKNHIKRIRARMEEVFPDEN